MGPGGKAGNFGLRAPGDSAGDGGTGIRLGAFAAFSASTRARSLLLSQKAKPSQPSGASLQLFFLTKPEMSLRRKVLPSWKEEKGAPVSKSLIAQKQ